MRNPGSNLLLGILLVCWSLGSLAEPIRLGMYGHAWIGWTIENEAVDFVIVQASLTRGDPVKAVRSLHEAGREAFLDLTIMKGVDRTKPLRTLADSVGLSKQLAQIEGIISQVGNTPVMGYSLGEENIYWNGHKDHLTDLYSALKARHPDHRFFQWYSPARRPFVPGGAWPLLPADGWVFDQYFVSGETYRYYVDRMRALERPLLSVVWASPGWDIADRGRRRSARPNWWNEDGWKGFYDQVSTNRHAGIDTAFFMFAAQGPKRRLVPLWRNKSSCSQAFLQVFNETTLPTIRAVDLPLERPGSKPAWIPDFCE